MFLQICSQIFTTNVSHFELLKNKTNFLLHSPNRVFSQFSSWKEIIKYIRKKSRTFGIQDWWNYLLNSLSNINSNSDCQLSWILWIQIKIAGASSKEIGKGAFTNYGVKILPIIDHLPRPLLTFVTEFLYCCMGKSAFCWNFQYHLPRLFNVVYGWP